jgi:hypothetical protein
MVPCDWSGRITLHSLMPRYVACQPDMRPHVSVVSLHWCMSDFSKEMAAFSWDKMIDILLSYGAADGNGKIAQRLYQERFPDRRIPHHSTFASINRRLRETGSWNINRHDCGRVRTVRTPRFEKALLNLVADTPSTSTRRDGHAMRAFHTAVWQVVHQQHLHPYHRQKVQTMGTTNYPRRHEFSQWFFQRCAAEPRFPSTVLYTDEKSFTRERIINQWLAAGLLCRVVW